MNTTLFTTGYHVLMPEAYPTIDKNRLKSYGDKYYLNDGQQFQLELYNPNWASKVMVKIWMNGKCISPSGLVIGSNDRVYLERYLDTNKKFKFKTFEVDDVQETEEARERNGVVKLEFYQQYVPSTITYTNYPTFTVNNTANLNHISTNWDTVTTHSGTICASYTSDSFTTNNLSKVETGRVFEGDISNQQMKTDYSSFMTQPFHTVEFQLLPQSLKPKELTEIRNYCSECGLRIRKSSWKYCPTCGNKL
jgi:hypothetical protein